MHNQSRCTLIITCRWYFPFSSSIMCTMYVCKHCIIIMVYITHINWQETHFRSVCDNWLVLSLIFLLWTTAVPTLAYNVMCSPTSANTFTLNYQHSGEGNLLPLHKLNGDHQRSIWAHSCNNVYFSGSNQRRKWSNNIYGVYIVQMGIQDLIRTPESIPMPLPHAIPAIHTQINTHSQTRLDTHTNTHTHGIHCIQMRHTMRLDFTRQHLT